MNKPEFGIYLNTSELKVLRINSPHWIPSGNEWILLSSDVNATLLNIREIAREKKIEGAEKIIWGDFPKI